MCCCGWLVFVCWFGCRFGFRGGMVLRYCFDYLLRVGNYLLLCVMGWCFWVTLWCICRMVNRLVFRDSLVVLILFGVCKVCVLVLCDCIVGVLLMGFAGLLVWIMVVRGSLVACVLGILFCGRVYFGVLAVTCASFTIVASLR